MKKALMIAFTAIFAVALVLGCTGGGETKTVPGSGTGDGYTFKVEPTTIQGGGVATVQFTITNPFEKNMDNVSVKMKSGTVPSSYKSDPVDGMTGQMLVPGQEFPVVFTITAPNQNGQINPVVQVCFDYGTEFYWDSAFMPVTLAIEEVSLDKGASTGPISVTVSGLDKAYVKNDTEGKGVGAIGLKNEWQGEIKDFKDTTINVAAATYLKSFNISYAGCFGTADQKTSKLWTINLKSGGTNCGVLKGITAKNGIQPTLTINLNKETKTDITVDRFSGTTTYNYCYEVPLGTLISQKVG
jgi:hypothetical protein